MIFLFFYFLPEHYKLSAKKDILHSHKLFKSRSEIEV
jgi:hypothetical protein